MNIDKVINFMDSESDKFMKMAKEESNCVKSDNHLRKGIKLFKAVQVLKEEYNI